MADQAYIQKSLRGAWRLMMGKSDGLKLLDLSVDGFWRSFYAIVLSVPALAIGWVVSAADLQRLCVLQGTGSIIGKIAVIQLASWILPLVLLALVAKTARLEDRLVHYVVSNNWASLITVWLMLPANIVEFLLPDATQAADALSLLLMLAGLVLTWRQTNASLEKGPAVATAVFFGMTASGIAVLLVLQSAFGLMPPV